MKYEMCIYVFLILKDIYCHLKKHMYVTWFYFCVYMSFKKKIVFGLGQWPPAFFLGIGPLYRASWSFSWHSTTPRRHISAFLLFHGQDDPQYSGPSGYLWVQLNSYGKFGWPCQEVSFLHDIPSRRFSAAPRRHMSALLPFCGQDGSRCSGPSRCPCVHAITYGKFGWLGQQVCFHHDKLSRRYFVIARSVPRQVCSTVRSGRVRSILALRRSAYASAKPQLTRRCLSPYICDVLCYCNMLCVVTALFTMRVRPSNSPHLSWTWCGFWFNIVDIHMSADTGSPAGLAYTAVSMDLCILEVGRPVSGPSPITKIDHTRKNNCVFWLHIVSMQLLARKLPAICPALIACILIVTPSTVCQIGRARRAQGIALRTKLHTKNFKTTVHSW